MNKTAERPPLNIQEISDEDSDSMGMSENRTTIDKRNNFKPSKETSIMGKDVKQETFNKTPILTFSVIGGDNTP